MSEKEEEYRRYAAEAESRAKKARNEEDRASWLRLWQGWLTLLPDRKRGADGSSQDTEGRDASSR